MIPEDHGGIFCSIKKHNKIEAKYWCHTCNAGICTLCSKTKHKGHNFSRITNVTVNENRDTNTCRFLNPNPSVQTVLLDSFVFPFIACVDKGLAWVNTSPYELQLVDKFSSVEDNINIEVPIQDMDVMSNGDIVYCERNMHILSLSTPLLRVCVIRQKKISPLIEARKRDIGGVRCLPNDDIVLTFPFEKEVNIYSGQGEIIRTLDIELRHPLKVAFNKVNHDICICDRFTNYTGEIIAVRADGQVHYTYKGRGDGKKRFYAEDVCTDHVGHVLIADGNNGEVQILDQDGNFLQSILTPDSYFNTIDVDREGYIWIVGRGHVKVSRYLI